MFHLGKNCGLPCPASLSSLLSFLRPLLARLLHPIIGSSPAGPVHVAVLELYLELGSLQVQSVKEDEVILDRVGP